MYYNTVQEDYENAVERESILEKIQSTFCSDGHKKCICSLYGESGMGKSFVCRNIFNSTIVTSDNRKALIDFNQIVNKNIPGILESIIASLGTAYFSETQKQLMKYYISIDASKSEVLNQCVTVFISELNSFTEKQEDSVLLIFDTYEALPIETRNKGFKQIIEAARGYVYFLISGIEQADFEQCENFKLDGFDEDEIRAYFVKRNQKMKTVFKKHGKLLASRIRAFTNDGHPILCGLLSDCVQRCRDIDDQIKYLINEEKDKSYWHLISWIKDLPSDLYTSLRVTAYFNDRMTPDLLSDISGMPIDTCRDCLQEITNFSFVKCFSEFDDKEPQIVLHDIVAELIRKYFPYQTDKLHVFADKAVLSYDKMIVGDRNNVDAFKNEKALRVERVLSIVRNGEFHKALSLFDSELINGLDEFDYSFITQLIAEIEAFLISSKDPRWAFLLQAARAEYELNQYDVKSAIAIFDALRLNELYSTPVYKAIADSVFGLSLVNPSTLDRAEKPSDAIVILNDCIAALTDSGLKSRVVKVHYWLGIAYVRTGQNDLAYKSFEEAKKQSTTDIQKVSILLEMSKMIRLQQDVKGALVPLVDCDAIMLTLNKNRGKYYYYKGNAYRDLGDDKSAISYYNQAFLELNAGDDDFTLCELNLDYAWLEYLRFDEVDMDKLRYFLDTGWRFAQQYHFGTEFSEYFHILYEIEHFLGQDEQAYRDLDSALEYAYKYSNIYMILDCLNHKAQMYYRKKEFGAIPKVIEDMDRVEKTGCKIRVFRGRAKLVQADVYYGEGRYDKAIEEYFDGFLIVALYGNSHTNVELFEDLYYGEGENGEISREEKIKICLSQLQKATPYIKKFKKIWTREKVSHDYDYFIDNMKIQRS